MSTPTTGAHHPSWVVLYLRTRDLDSASAVGQEIRLRQFLLSQPDWHPVAEYHDYGPGADGRQARPALRRAIADARTGQFDVLLVASLDRLGRDPTKMAALLADLDRAGVAISTADGAVDTTRPNGRFALSVLTAMAEFETAIQDDHNRAARRRRRRARRAAHRRLHDCG